MEQIPAEVVRLALMHQGSAHSLMAGALEEMKKARALIAGLQDAHGNQFICGGELYVIDHVDADPKWPHHRSRMLKSTDTPVIDKQDTVPEMLTEQGILRGMGEGPIPLAFDEIETQPPEKGGACY